MKVLFSLSVLQKIMICAVCNRDKNTHNLHAVLLAVSKWFTPFCEFSIIF